MNRQTRVLVVEDELVIAIDLESELRDRGFDVLGPAGSVEDAMRLIDAEQPTLALLDVNLGGSDSMEIAKRLEEMAVPTIFVSGYNGAMAPESLAGQRVLGKPIDYPALCKAMEEELAKASGAAK